MTHAQICKAFLGLLTRLIQEMNISNSIYREPEWGADGFKIKPRRGEALRRRKSTKPASERGSFQIQQSPGVKLMESSSRYLFVALFWSSGWLWSTKPGRYIKGQSGPYKVKSSWVMCIKDQKRPPRFKLLKHNHTVLESLWTTTDHVTKL